MKLIPAVVLAIVGFGSGCRCTGPSASGVDSSRDAAVPPLTEPPPDEVVAVDLIQEVSRCAVLHRGVLLDLGGSADEGRFDYSTSPPREVTRVEFEGATWARVLGRTLSQRFVLDRDSPIFAQIRVHGGSARSVTVLLDDKAIGSVRLPKDTSAVVSTSPTTDAVAAGPHQITLQFHGSRKGQTAADVDWIRVGVPDTDPTTYAAPTQRDLVIDTTIRDQPRRAIALRAPGSVRCQIAIPDRSVFRTVIGYTGPGEGEAELIVHEPGQPSAVLQTAKLGGESQTAVEVELPLDSFAGRVIDLELRATVSTPGGRVLFGEPAVRLPPVALPPREPAQVAIVLVLSGTAPTQLPPYRDVPALATLTDVAAASATFRHHRTTSTFAGASMASLMTGLPPSAHMVVDGGARLSDRTATLGTMARDGRVTTAMFTGNPTTFSAFGFERGWDRFLSFSPVSGASPRAPLIEAARWLEKRLEGSHDGRLLAVVHARGVHPPWAATSEEIRNLPPEEYAGPIEARRGAEILATARAHSKIHLKPADRQRIDGFCSLALVGEDQSLSQLIAVLRKARVWDKTLLIITSDIALGAPSRIPFGDGAELGEDMLDLPLIVRFPGNRHAGKVIASPTSPADVLATLLAALQLEGSNSSAGRDLFELATNPARYPSTPQVAELGASYSVRLGDFLLQGTSPRTPVLCELNAVGECGDDLSTTRPFLGAYLWQATYRHFRAAASTHQPPLQREPATLDPDTVAALTVWGDLQPR